MFVFRHTKLSNHQILSGADNHPKGQGTGGSAGAAAKLLAAATAAEFPGVSVPGVASAGAAGSNPRIVSIPIVTNFPVQIEIICTIQGCVLTTILGASIPVIIGGLGCSGISS